MKLINLSAIILLAQSHYAISQDMTGKIDIGQLKGNQNFEWFDKRYKESVIDKTSADKLKPLLENIKIVMFAGTWCSDTKKLLPSFIRLLDEAGFNYSNAEIYMLDTFKKSPGGQEKAYDIEYVPTFIFYRNKKELGRIVEEIKSPLESEVRSILNKH